MFLFAMVVPFITFAQHEEHAVEGKKDLKTEIKEDIKHHLQDSHDFHLFTDKSTETHVGFPLPVILIDGGLHIFMSSAFHHDDAATLVVESNGKKYTKFHGKIYNANPVADEHGSYVTVDADHHPTNAKPLDFSITKNVFSIFAISLLLFWLVLKAANNYKKSLVPSGAAKFFEPIIIFVRDEIAIPNIGEKHYKRFMSYLLTVFFFIWLVNLFGLTPLGVNVTNSISVTFALAMMTFVITQFSAKAEYWKHIFWMPGVPVPMKILLAPIELLGVFIKPFALLIRLYANITAGHVVLMSLIGLMFIFKSWIGSPLSFGLALSLSLLELLVAALQAYIFTMLTALYFGSAVAEHEHEHAEHEHH